IRSNERHRRQQFGNAADRSSDARQPTRHRLEERARRAFGPAGGENEQVRSVELPNRCSSRKGTPEMHPVRDAKAGCQPLKAWFLATASDHHQLRIETGLHASSKGGDQDVGGLVTYFEGTDINCAKWSVTARIGRIARQ